MDWSALALLARPCRFGIHASLDTNQLCLSAWICFSKDKAGSYRARHVCRSDKVEQARLAQTNPKALPPKATFGLLFLLAGVAGWEAAWICFSKDKAGLYRARHVCRSDKVEQARLAQTNPKELPPKATFGLLFLLAGVAGWEAAWICFSKDKAGLYRARHVCWSDKVEQARLAQTNPKELLHDRGIVRKRVKSFYEKIIFSKLVIFHLITYNINN